MNWYKKAQKENSWNMKQMFLGMKVSVIAALLGVSVYFVAKQIEENPNELKDKIQQAQQQNEEYQNKDFSSSLESFSYNDVVAMIERHEGKKNKVYLDSLGIPHIGIGFNLHNGDAKYRLSKLGINIDEVLEGKEISDEQIYSLLKEDLDEAIVIAQSFLPNFNEHPAKIQTVLINMAFNLNNRLHDFVKLRQALLNKDYQTATLEMIDSKWFKQVGNRSQELVYMMSE
jgi:lysozyme